MKRPVPVVTPPRLPRDDREIVAGVLLEVRGTRLRIATDDGHKEVEVWPGHHFVPGMEVRIYGHVKCCEEWTKAGQAVAQ